MKPKSERRRATAKPPPRMTCPECGTEMNHHADKLLHLADPKDAARVDPVLGGILVEHHVCPNCGRAEAREV